MVGKQIHDAGKRKEKKEKRTHILRGREKERERETTSARSIVVYLEIAPTSLGVNS